LQDARNRFVHSYQAVDAGAAKSLVIRWENLLTPLLKEAAKKLGEQLPPWDSYDQLNMAVIAELE
jgi:uncharacterized protein YutE (UPF0331/DUF86 family)